MHLELVIVDGPQAGRRVPLGRAPVTFGRSSGAVVSFPLDSFMSGMHLSVQYALSCVIVIDLRSSNGTFLNGQRINQAMAVPGDVIRIGNLTMRLAVGTAPAPEAAEPTDLSEPIVVAPTLEMPAVTEPMIEAIAEPAVEAIAAPVPAPVEKVHQSVLNLLCETALPLFCLVDPGTHEMIPTLLGAAPEPKESLYDGAADNVLSKFAPYVVQLGPDSALLHALVENGWGRGWVCFFTSGGAAGGVGQTLSEVLHGAVGRRQRNLFPLLRPACAARIPACGKRGGTGGLLRAGGGMADRGQEQRDDAENHERQRRAAHEDHSVGNNCIQAPQTASFITASEEFPGCDRREGAAAHP